MCCYLLGIYFRDLHCEAPRIGPSCVRRKRHEPHCEVGLIGPIVVTAIRIASPQLPSPASDFEKVIDREIAKK